MQLEISDKERELLLKMAEVGLGELRAEVRRTATKDYHDELVAEESILIGLIDRLRSAA
jgi:hypothetical protein